MTVLKGYESYLGFLEVSTTTENATAPGEFLYTDDISFTRTKEEEIIPELGIQSRGLRRRVTKNIEAAGSFTRSVDPNNGIALYQYILGGSLTTASVSSLTYSHVFSEGDEVPSATRLQFEVSLGGSSATSYRFYNGIGESYSYTAGIGAVAKETFGLKFSNHGAAINTQNAVSLTQTPPITGNNVSVKMGLTITAVSTVATKDITLNINNTLIENRGLGSAEVTGFCYDTREVNGSMNLTFETAAQYQKYLDETYTALQILCTSTDVTSNTAHSIQIDLPEVWFNGSTPQVGGTGEIIQPIEFSAIYSSNATYQVKVTVINADAAVSK